MAVEIVIGEAGPDGIINIAQFIASDVSEVPVCEFTPPVNGSPHIIKTSFATFKIEQEDFPRFVETFVAIGSFLRSQL